MFITMWRIISAFPAFSLLINTLTVVGVVWYTNPPTEVLAAYFTFEVGLVIYLLALNLLIKSPLRVKYAAAPTMMIVGVAPLIGAGAITYLEILDSSDKDFTLFLLPFLTIVISHLFILTETKVHTTFFRTPGSVALFVFLLFQSALVSSIILISATEQSDESALITLLVIKLLFDALLLILLRADVHVNLSALASEKERVFSVRPKQ